MSRKLNPESKVVCVSEQTESTKGGIKRGVMQIYVARVKNRRTVAVAKGMKRRDVR